MMWTPLLRSLQSARARAGSTPAGSRCRRLTLEYLEDRTVPSGVTTIATMGDSLTAPYPSWAPWGAAGDQSWAQQLAAQGNRHLAIDNVAVPGTTSSQLLTDGQVSTVAHLVATGAVQYATLIVGANDVVFDYLPTIIQGNPAPFVQAVTGNIESALTTVAAAGDVGLAVGNIPDVGLTPSLRYELTQELGVPASQLPAVLQNITTATTLANDEIEAFAARHGIPVIDLFGSSQVIAGAATSPVSVGGMEVSNLYAPDYFHPNTVAQGLLADAVLEALGDAYNPRLERFQLTDQQILDDAHIAHGPGHSYFDVSPFVIYHPRHHGGHGHDADGASGYRGRGEADSCAGVSFTHARRHAASDEVLDRVFAGDGVGS